MADGDGKQQKFKELMADPELRKLIEDFAASKAETLVNRQSAGFAKELLAALERYNEHHDFSVGDLIQWKPSMQNRRLPSYGEAIVVLEILETPVETTQDPASPYFGEKLDLKCGALDSSEEFVTIFLPGSRFEPFTPSS